MNYLITILPVIAAGIWAVLKFNQQLKDKRFKIYHELVDDLVNEQKQPDRKMKLDRQVAIIFELRNYPSYYPVSKRILVELREYWAHEPRLIKEIDLTLEFITARWPLKVWRRFWKI